MIARIRKIWTAVGLLRRFGKQTRGKDSKGTDNKGTNKDTGGIVRP